MAEILLIQPKTHGRSTVRPLGLGYLASSLLRRGHAVTILDNDLHNYEVDQIRDIVAETQPDMVGITTNILSQWNAREIGKAVAGACKHVVYGGPQATLDPASFVVSENATVIPGEAEENFARFVETKTLMACPTQRDLDAIPFPDMDHFEWTRYRWALDGRPCTNMVSSRGCPFKCIYCYHQMNAVFRQRSVGNVLEEMRTLRDRYGFRAIKFFDDNFTMRPKWVEEFCQAMMAENMGMLWQCIGAARTVNEDIIGLMAEAGCRQISFGIESGSQQSLDRMGKRTTVEQNRQAIRACQKAGIQAKAYLIIGFPWETPKDFAATEQFVRDVKPDIMQLFFATPFPNTDLARLVESSGYVIDWTALQGARDFNKPSFETEHFTKADLLLWHQRIRETHKHVTRGNLIQRIVRKGRRILRGWT